MPVQSAMPPVGAASSSCLVWEVSELGERLLTMLFPHLAGLRVHRMEDAGDAVVISASCRATSACCPRCGTPSSRVHGGYARMVADGAAGGPFDVILINGASPCNIYWQVGSSAVLGAQTFYGNVLALGSITLTSATQFTGRALARNGAVTISIASLVTNPGGK